jgi:excisionase family DNA binding protein
MEGASATWINDGLYRTDERSLAPWCGRWRKPRAGPSLEQDKLCATVNVLEETQLLTVAEVARRLRQSERTVRDKIASGALPAVKIGTGPRAPIRVDPAKLDAWLEANHNDVTPAERRGPGRESGTVDATAATGQGDR